ncbi:sigma-70 family RNA polymerase sigma factor [Steroidobacter sp. S1-65]|uniref:Sigma-70 family RNA polymerase sigma factor n=1 Tax=Steroidobacter gossypii TaxID=2805490 RepID=A0ABS1WVA5_9GAMM|nr:sigma-70 family RNA polymerase sigma factor [Steroidobacter gossypii]
MRSSVDVQDLAQETYLRLLRSRDLSDVRKPLAYLLQVASHVALEWGNRQARNAALGVVEAKDLIDEQLPELELDAGLTQQRIEQTLAACSPTMRAVLLLRLRDQRSCQEIANDLGISMRTVQRHLENGYARLRMAIEG